MKTLKFDNITTFRNYLKNSKDGNFLLDISSMNLFDSLKFLVLSSIYFYQKFPEMKLKCRVQSEDVKSLAKTFKVQNLEFNF